jgi:hypothetical protein
VCGRAQGQTASEYEHLKLAKLFAKAVRCGPFKETSEGSGEWLEVADLEELEEFLPSKLEDPMTVTLSDGAIVQLSTFGATLYASKMGMLIHVRNQFNKLLADRVRESTNPAVRVKGVERRKELTTLFAAISAAELKKGVKALGLTEGTKPEMLTKLIDRFAPKKKRKRTPVAAEAEALPADIGGL